MAKKTQNPTGDIGPGSPIESLRDDYEKQLTLFDAQPPIVQRFLEVQARLVAEAFTERGQRVRFMLPDRVTAAEKSAPFPVPEKAREQVVGKFSDRLAGRDVHTTLKQKLTELESSPDQAIAVSTGLIRFAAAQHIVHNMLPAGRSVTYSAAEGEEIPSIPTTSAADPESAITAATDAITEEGKAEEGRGSLQVPYVPAARRFYLPQWVAFDDQGKLLVNSTDEAEAHVASMQKFLEVLFAARSLAPYMVADEEFERKRYGMLGQLVNQGRALAVHTTKNIIATIKQRAADQSLNRGLGLRLPYFDDQDLHIKHHDFVVIPAGRIMFIPAFVVRAAQEEKAKAAQDTRLNLSTRKHLLHELTMLEEAFESVK
ncbi:MAG: hypothetical protein HY781_02110 [Chloroflexi bacterium]|nr:hypothetical protein [Chloroflexota bacterium]